MTFDDAFTKLIGNEGGYSNNPADPGAETMWGVTARVARANGYTGDMRSMPLDTAKAIARKVYWDAAHCDELPAELRFPMLDAAYNSGVTQAVKWLQRAVGVVDDGAIGPITLNAARNDPRAVAVRMTALRLDFLTSLPTWGAFGRGWARRIVGILQGV